MNACASGQLSIVRMIAKMDSLSLNQRTCVRL